MLYNKFSEYLKKRYGEKVRKLSLNIGADCPNRDGTISRQGCFFCDYTKSGFDAPDPKLSIVNQIENGIEYYKKHNINKLIAYFQVGTNTYYDIEKLQQYINIALKYREIVSISISTRPDCIDDEVIKLLNNVKSKTDLVVELGMQTANYRTLIKINRGHTLSEFINSAILLQKNNIFTVAHVIIGLPGDDKIDIIETAKIINALNINAVKLHSLYISNDSVFGIMYKKGKIKPIEFNTYVDWAISFLEHLDQKVIVERLVSKPPRYNVLFSNWQMSWKKIINIIESEMIRRESYQGKKLKRFSIRKVINNEDK